MAIPKVPLTAWGVTCESAQIRPGTRTYGLLIALPRRGETVMGLIRDFMFLMLFFVLLAVWFVAWAAMHITAGTIHILLLVAVVMLVLHFVAGRRAV
jgi:hypothetical protein